MSELEANVVADSIYDTGTSVERLISVQATNPKFLDAEIEKHRMLSTNSSSSRAIPLSQSLADVQEDPYIPPDIRLKEKGMQGYRQVSPNTHRDLDYSLRTFAGQVCGFVEKIFGSNDIHKQHANRYLEPFLLQTKIVTANEGAWRSAIALRSSPYADPSIQEWASQVEHAILLSEPSIKKEGDWHLAYITEEERSLYNTTQLCKMSVARCARVSYKNQEKPYGIEKEASFADRLLKDGHMSCFEHQATPAPSNILDSRPWPVGITAINRELAPLSGNFKWWIQYRQIAL